MHCKAAIGLFAVTAAALGSAPAQAQVVVDVARITCDQYVRATVASPDDIGLWLSGYYHGEKHVSTLDVNKFEEDVRNFRAACRLPDNFNKPIMQLIESTLVK